MCCFSSYSSLDGTGSVTTAVCHPLRGEAKGRMVISVPVILAQDDVSGNQSKVWNKHYCIYMNNGCLPREQMQKEVNVHFVGTSSHATPTEMMQGVRRIIRCVFYSTIRIGTVTNCTKYLCRHTLQHPHTCMDVETRDEILIRIWPLLLPADNPMAAEHCCGAGLNANYFCRSCEAGGTQEYKSSPEGYESLFHVSLSAVAFQSSLFTIDETIHFCRSKLQDRFLPPSLLFRINSILLSIHLPHPGSRKLFEIRE